MPARRNKNAGRGFTLIEILFVVIILGVLAAIVIPRFASAEESTRKAALSDQLNAIRTQIHLFIVQNEDRSPTLDGADWNDLITQTTYGSKPRGPYLPSIPINPLNNYTNVLVVAADPNFGDAVAGANIGFVYNPNSGFIWGTNRAGDLIYNEANANDPNNW
jgi:prepilin-type N-terminal cleavage/methylation domain-containing protein